MTKQEFMAMSLPYGLHAEILDYKCDYVGNQYDLIIGILQWSKDGDMWCLQTKGGARPSFDRVKPILHPISDLTKEIEHKGEKFVPIVELKKIDKGIWMNGEKLMYRLSPINKITEYPFFIIQKLIEWHFDLMDESEEFIDVNTLETNPYK